MESTTPGYDHPALQHYWSGRLNLLACIINDDTLFFSHNKLTSFAYQRTNGVFLSQHFNINIIVSQISAEMNRTDISDLR
jgi:hypothetical protein